MRSEKKRTTSPREFGRSKKKRIRGGELYWGGNLEEILVKKTEKGAPAIGPLSGGRALLTGKKKKKKIAEEGVSAKKRGSSSRGEKNPTFYRKEKRS